MILYFKFEFSKKHSFSAFRECLLHFRFMLQTASLCLAEVNRSQLRHFSLKQNSIIFFNWLPREHLVTYDKLNT